MVTMKCVIFGSLRFVGVIEYYHIGSNSQQLFSLLYLRVIPMSKFWFVIGFAARLVLYFLPSIMCMLVMGALSGHVLVWLWWAIYAVFCVIAFAWAWIADYIIVMSRLALGAYEIWLFERAQKKAAERIGRKVLRDNWLRRPTMSDAALLFMAHTHGRA